MYEKDNEYLFLDNNQPEELSEDLVDVTGDSRLPTDVSFWRKFGKMVRRINWFMLLTLYDIVWGKNKPKKKVWNTTLCEIIKKALYIFQQRYFMFYIATTFSGMQRVCI